MLKKTKKLALNFKILKFFLLPVILVSTPFLNKIQDAKAGLEFQWNQDSVYRRLKWFQKEDKRKLRNDGRPDGGNVTGTANNGGAAD